MNLDDDSPNGEGSMRRYFLGEDEEEQDCDGDTPWTHRRLFGDTGLIRGSKSTLLFRVAPHAMTSTFLMKLSALQLLDPDKVAGMKVLTV